MKNIFLLLLMAVNITAFAQNINGEVVDSKSHTPIAGATIYIPELEKWVVTDFDGRFGFAQLPEGIHELVISSLGYSSTTLKVNTKETDQLVISLMPTAIEMEEVIISTPFHQLQSENVMKVERVNLETLARKGAATLADGITSIAGVESITTGSGIGKPVIRGLSSNRVLVYTQGVRLENQQFGDEHGLGVSSSGIESVEVIKGPASLLYGSDALGGVLYLNPEKYAASDSTELDARALYYTNTLGTEVNAGIKKSFNKWKFLLRGNHASHSDYLSGDGERVANSRFSEFDLKAGTGYRDEHYKGDLRYNYNELTAGIPVGKGSSTSKKVLEPYQEIENHVLSLDNTFYFGKSSLDLKIGFLVNDRKEFEDHHHHDAEDHEEEHPEEYLEEAHSEEAALRMLLKTLNYDLKYHFPEKGKFETIIGVQGMYQDNTNLGEEFLIPNATTTDLGILATTHYHLDRFDFQAGIRFDNRQIDSEVITGEAGRTIPAVDRNFNSYNGALGVKMNLFPKFTTRLNLATGFRAPNLAELTSHGSHHGSNRYEIGNSGLGNEKNYQADLSLEYRTDHFEIFGNVFYNILDNYIYLRPTGEVMDDKAVYNYVQNNAELYGSEAGIHLHPHPLDWLHWESSFEIVNGKQRNGNHLPLIPAPSITNTFRMEFAELGRITNTYSFISLKSTFRQNKVAIFEEATPAYSLLSAGVGGEFQISKTKMLLQISGENLLNNTYYSHLSRLKVDGLANMGRNISLRLKADLW